MISKDEQAKRFHERIEDKTKNWKFNEGDIKEREYWETTWTHTMTLSRSAARATRLGM